MENLENNVKSCIDKNIHWLEYTKKFCFGKDFKKYKRRFELVALKIENVY